eukprot:2241561-Rhodomonas_salina.4
MSLDSAAKYACAPPTGDAPPPGELDEPGINWLLAPLLDRLNEKARLLPWAMPESALSSVTWRTDGSVFV